MEFILVHCWSCAATFYTFSEMATHHLDTHEQPLPSRLQVVQEDSVAATIRRSPLEERIISPLFNGDDRAEGL